VSRWMEPLIYCLLSLRWSALISAPKAAGISGSYSFENSNWNTTHLLL